MNIDFKTIDKSKFECLQTSKDDKGQVYFGLTAFHHCETGEVRKDFNVEPKQKEEKKEEVSKATPPVGGKTPAKGADKKAAAIAEQSAAEEPGEGEMSEEERAKYRKVRHGVGVQLYGKNPQGIVCKYAGDWYADEKTGDGHSVFPNGAEYQGYSIKGIFNGQGHYTWPMDDVGKRHSYLGEWVAGKMNGQGEFYHKNGHTLRGTFVNNLYLSINKGKKYFLEPMESKEQHEQYIKNCVSSKIYVQKQEQEKNEKCRIFKVKTVAELEQAIADSKDAERTPVLVACSDSNLTSTMVINALERGDEQQKCIQQLHLRAMARQIEKENIQYQARPDYIADQFELTDSLLCALLTGETKGQIMLNFDEFPVSGQSDELTEESVSDSENEKEELPADEKAAATAKKWNHMYEPDYQLLINPKVFPVELMQGKLVGEYMIHELHLFDRNLKPQNIAFSNSGGADSHTIQISPYPKGIGKRKTSQETVNDAERTGQFDQQSSFQQANASVAENSVRQDSLNEDCATQNSPRSNMTDQQHYLKQKRRLDELKQEALAKLLGMDHFTFMVWSKVKFASRQFGDDELLDQFKKRFKNGLPTKYLDMVLIQNIK